MNKYFLLIILVICGCSNFSNGEVNRIEEIKVGDSYIIINGIYLYQGKDKLFLSERNSNDFNQFKIEQGTLLKVIKLRQERYSAEIFWYVTREFITIEIISGEHKGKQAEAVYIFKNEVGEYKNRNKYIQKYE